MVLVHKIRSLLMAKVFFGHNNIGHDWLSPGHHFRFGSNTIITDQLGELKQNTCILLAQSLFMLGEIRV